MRRIAILIACLLIACLLAMPASAATAAQRIESVFTVAANGDITVSLQLSLYLDAAVPDLAFPVPEDAKRITVNGGSARTRKGDDLLLVDLSKVCATPGAHTVTITYQTGEQVARKVVDDDGKTLPASQQKYYFHLPLLCSFFYPVESMKFTILLPRELTVRPQFLSGYHQELADAYIDLTYDGNQITGVLKGPMQDRETLEMVLPAEEMFPGLVQRQQAFGTEEKIMCLLAAVSLLYWLLFLRTKRAKPGLTPTPPDGLTAGQLGSVLTGQGADLTMMVLSWAQLGYILIHLDDHGRVMLHKRMEMGNERSAFENKCFRSLFGKRRMVDGDRRPVRPALPLCRRLQKGRQPLFPPPFRQSRHFPGAGGSRGRAGRRLSGRSAGQRLIPVRLSHRAVRPSGGRRGFRHPPMGKVPPPAGQGIPAEPFLRGGVARPERTGPGLSGGCLRGAVRSPRRIPCRLRRPPVGIRHDVPGSGAGPAEIPEKGLRSGAAPGHPVRSGVFLHPRPLRLRPGRGAAVRPELRQRTHFRLPLPHHRHGRTPHRGGMVQGDGPGGGRAGPAAEAPALRTPVRPAVNKNQKPPKTVLIRSSGVLF